MLQIQTTYQEWSANTFVTTPETKEVVYTSLTVYHSRIDVPDTMLPNCRNNPGQTQITRK